MGNINEKIKPQKNILICGLENSGKTTLLYKLFDLFQTEDYDGYIDDSNFKTTYGFNFETIVTKYIDYNLMEFGNKSISNNLNLFVYKTINIDYLIYILDYIDFIDNENLDWFQNLNILANEDELSMTDFIIIINVKSSDISLTKNEIIKYKNVGNNLIEYKLDINSVNNINDSNIKYDKSNKRHSLKQLDDNLFYENNKLGNLINYDYGIFSPQYIKKIFLEHFDKFTYIIANKEISVYLFNIKDKNAIYNFEKIIENIKK